MSGLVIAILILLGNKSKKQGKDYELLSRQFAERYGIVEYRVKGNTMIYNVSYPAYLSNPRYTIQHTVNLDSEVEQTKQLKRFDSKGLVNRYVFYLHIN